MNRVLITGGTGFLGRGLAARLIENGDVDRICIFSRGEHTQAQMRQEIADPEGKLRWFIGDVRERDRLRRAMEGIDLVIHAAALKRVEVGEYNPAEMVRTNVLGAINVIEAAHDSGVEKVVAISTDKASAPLNAYGATKLTVEKLMLAANNARGASGPRFAVCRYGNVAGSTGSVIPIWRERIRKLKAAGEPAVVPVTDPTCTRFWMSIDEACALILWTADRMEGGELVVPTLPAYRLQTLAEAMDAVMEVRGLGQGEKRDETMISPYESPSFRWIPPYMVKGGLAEKHEANIAGISTRMLTVDELRGLLAGVA
jgi:UDP-N-acetylglucosamine 4,6-dehydratase